jgi:glycosyltransferase involved in cell wall biosynthesis
MEVHSLRKNKIITGPNMLNSIRPIYDRKIGQKTILKCDHLIALSKKDEELYLQMGIGKSKITIIPPGIMESFFVKPEEDQVRKVKIALEADPALLSVGELSWIKSHAVMIKALNIIVKERPHAKLFIIGRNRTELGNLKNLSEKLGLVKNVYFLGFKNENEVKTYMHCSDLFLHTSLAEGLSTALLESMACGLPYITTPAGGNGYLAQESNAGVVVPFEDEAALANAVLSLTNDKKTHEKLSSNGCTYAQNLRWDKVFSRIVQIYNDLSNNDKS